MPRTQSSNPGSHLATILIVALVVVALYVGRGIFVPIALAILLSFLLAPLVLRIERWGVGRVPGVLIVATMAFVLLAGLGTLITAQLVDLASSLPQYRSNIRERVEFLRPSETGVFSRAWDTIASLQSDLSREVEEDPSAGQPSTPGVSPEPEPVPVRLVEPTTNPVAFTRSVIAPLLGPLGTAGLVIIFVIFILIQWEDLRDRVIRLIGPRQIHATTEALSDAGRRVSRYLLMQSIINGTYGLVAGSGLFLIGVPNAPLWGLLAALLRFIPYVGPWVGAGMPILVSLAVTDGWTQPLLTVGMFLLLELISNNVMEPWLYGSGTGVSIVAIIVGAVFWTWMWGPVGLLLATPLTVCLVVIGRHVPQLAFFDVLLSDQPALSQEAHFYQRLVAMDQEDAAEIVEEFLVKHSRQQLYDQVFIPALRMAEQDRHRDALLGEREEFLYQSIRTLIEELAPDVEIASPEPAASTQVQALVIPGHDKADELAGLMLVQLLRAEGVSAKVIAAEASPEDRVNAVGQHQTKVVCVSSIPPAAVVNARYLCKRLRTRYPEQELVVGLWVHTQEISKARERLRSDCTDNIVTNLEQAIQLILPLVRPEPVEAAMQTPDLPPNEVQRLVELQRLNLLDTPPEEAFDRYTLQLAKAFDVPMALITLIDRDRQWWKSQVGLPDELAQARCTSRELSVCGHVVADNQVLVVEDLLRDKRFANNPLIRQTGMRFYAGAPLRTDSGYTIGALCVIDTKPRRFSERDRQLLQLAADGVMSEVRSRRSVEESNELSRQMARQTETLAVDMRHAGAVQQQLVADVDRESERYGLCSLHHGSGTIGGDVLSVVQHDAHRLTLLVADPAANGVEAAMLGALVRSDFQRLAVATPPSHELLAQLQEVLQRLAKPDQAVMALVMTFDAERRELTLAGADHPGPILLRRGKAELLSAPVAPALLARAEELEIRSATFSLEAGDRLVLFTDGAVEAVNGAGEVLGLTRLMRFVQGIGDSGGHDLLEGVLSEVQRYANHQLHDDVVLALLECW